MHREEEGSDVSQQLEVIVNEAYIQESISKDERFYHY